jgi:excisionase family DNA binding protein
MSDFADLQVLGRIIEALLLQLGRTAGLPSMLTYDDIKALTTMDRTTVYRLVKAGKFPAPVRVGGRTLFRREDYTAWYAEPEAFD